MVLWINIKPIIDPHTLQSSNFHVQLKFRPLLLHELSILSPKAVVSYISYPSPCFLISLIQIVFHGKCLFGETHGLP